MKHFLIATNCIKDENLLFSSKIEAYIRERGGTCRCVVGKQEENTFSFQIEESEPFDCVLALGGDGTILKVSRDLRGRKIPILGVNLGTLGFLAEVEPEQIYPVIDRLFLDDYELEKRMNICGAVYKQGSFVLEDTALNDIVITRAGFSRIIGLKIYVNGKVLDIYEADGVIVSTPTGSTGYNLSAGGPIVSPKTSLMMITPISPHSLTSKSIVLSSEDEIVIEVLKMRKAQKEEAIVSFDGQPGPQLSAGDRIVISKAQITTRMLKLYDFSFFEVLREKITNPL